jgi:hypothetical protein
MFVGFSFGETVRDFLSLRCHCGGEGFSGWRLDGRWTIGQEK